MYAGYFERMSRDVKCPKVTSKSEQKNSLLHFPSKSRHEWCHLGALFLVASKILMDKNILRCAISQKKVRKSSRRLSKFQSFNIKKVKKNFERKDELSRIFFDEVNFSGPSLVHALSTNYFSFCLISLEALFFVGFVFWITKKYKGKEWLKTWVCTWKM